MGLAPGTRLGPYEIHSAIGAGGMGEVYRARDTRLDRTVAIKILAPELAGDAVLRARFEREARAVAALDHPHICAVYDVGQHDDVHFLVMPHLEGDTLATRLAKSAAGLPLPQAVKVATEIADALDRTHRAGITHRDLKPANIMLTKSGAKLLDFGLAKLRPTTPISLSGMTRLAETTADTASGTILGTVHYMAPEQVEGREADTRSDIWALGAVLYEMMTGRRPFDGDSPASVIGAILKDDPPKPSTRQPLAPPALDHLVGRCLVKDRDERWQSAGDVKHELAWITHDSGAAALRTAPTRRRPRLFTAIAAGGTALLIAAVGLLSWSAAIRTDESPAQPILRLAVDLGPDAAEGTSWDTLAISPDGARIVFVSRDAAGVSYLSTRRLDEFEAIRLAGTAGAYAPFFSPDGQWVGFFSTGKLRKVLIEGGEPITLCDAPAGRGGSWNEDGSIVAALDARSGLSLVSSDGGVVTPVTQVEPGELTHRWPQVLPGGKAVLFTVNSRPANYQSASIAVASLGSTEKRKRVVLADAGMFPRYLPSGHLAYVSKGTLYVVAFDSERLEVSGTAKPILDGLSADASFGSAQVAFSVRGAMLYRPGRGTGERVVGWLNADGTFEAFDVAEAFYQMLRVSPAGSRVAWAVPEGANTHIWVYDWERGSQTRLTSGQGVNTDPVWSPDGRHIVFSSPDGLSWVPADGAQPPRPLTKGQGTLLPVSFSADGIWMSFFEHRGGRSLIHTARVESRSGSLQSRDVTLFRELPTGNAFPAFSPDGKWIAYSSAESGVYEVYVRAFPDSGKQWQVSTNGGTLPVWSRTDNDLFYRTEDQRLMVTTYSATADSFVAGKPRTWSAREIFNTGLTPNFDLAPDGRRFAVLMPQEARQRRDARRDAMLVQNFFDEVRRHTTVER